MRALIFDLDGTLVDTVYAHVLAWQLTPAEAGRHGELYRRLLPVRRPFPGAVALVRRLHESGVSYGIATSGRRPDIDASLAALELTPDVVVIDRQAVAHAKPALDLFLECQRRLGVPPEECYVVGDAVWDLLAARRAHMLGIGLLTGGYGHDELLAAGAYQVFRDAAELDDSLEDLGIVPER
jgi:HAD superfamily hydrolase (TIGR01509 family)